MPRSTYDNEWPGELRQLEVGRPMGMPTPVAGEGAQWPTAREDASGESLMGSTQWPENQMQSQGGGPAMWPENQMQSQGGSPAMWPENQMQGQGGGPAMWPENQMQSQGRSPAMWPENQMQGQGGSSAMWPQQQTQHQMHSQSESAAMRPGEQMRYQSDGTADGLQMKNQVDIDIMENPRSNAEAFRGSLRALLNRNIGFYVVASFLVGTEGPLSWEGILYSVGNDYVVIYQPDVDRYISGDLYALKFVEFHNTRSMSPWAGYRRRDGHTAW